MATHEQVPVYTNLKDVHGALGTSLNHAERWNTLAEEYQKRFGEKPAYIARAPGRVNIIGEHIDYCLFGVLPAAVEHDILVACGPRTTAHSLVPLDQNAPGTVVAENLEPKYTPQSFTPKRQENIQGELVDQWQMDINKHELRWDSYVKAGYFGVLNRYFPQSSTASPVPVNLLVSGIVPAGSGLSSSAAMVVANTLAFLSVNGKLDSHLSGANNIKVTKGELVKLAVENERRVGVNSGGMDQSASVVSITSSALYITFFPSLDVSPVPLPPGAVLVCANSLIVSDKAVTAKTNYNLRVVETLVAARILAKHLGVSVGDKEKVTLREVLGRWSGEKERVTPGEEIDSGELKKALERVIPEVEVLKPATANNGQLGVTMEEMIQMTGMSADAFNELYLSWVEVEATHFQLYKRALHVYSEALRVLQFRQICLDAAQAQSWSTQVSEELGKVMNESQKSCNELFQCSCPELNQLTDLARSAGAYGSRLTGAGWGGCSVSLVAESNVESFISKLKNEYPLYKDLDAERFKEVVFATKPSSGACVYKFE